VVFRRGHNLLVKRVFPPDPLHLWSAAN
jgi:hypothetical protein